MTTTDAIQDWVTATVDRAPPLSQEQRDQLRLLLAPVDRAEAA